MVMSQRKASGLIWAAEYLNVPVDSVVAFGDMPNDIPMLNLAGHGVATVEEIAVVTPEGGRFLSSFQREIWIFQ